MIVSFGTIYLPDATTTWESPPILMAGANGISIELRTLSLGGTSSPELGGIVKISNSGEGYEALNGMALTATANVAISSTAVGTNVETVAANADDGPGDKNDVTIGSQYVKLEFKLIAGTSPTSLFMVIVNTFST
jgi:hypothetical protein